MTVKIIVIVSVCVAILFVLYVIKLIVARGGRNKPIRYYLNYNEGKFYVSGKQKNFKIKKDGRFVFNVVNGQIVSVKDKSASSDIIKYGGN